MRVSSYPHAPCQTARKFSYHSAITIELSITSCGIVTLGGGASAS